MSTIPLTNEQEIGKAMSIDDLSERLEETCIEPTHKSKKKRAPIVKADDEKRKSMNDNREKVSYFIDAQREIIDTFNSSIEIVRYGNREVIKQRATAAYREGMNSWDKMEYKPYYNVINRYTRDFELHSGTKPYDVCTLLSNSINFMSIESVNALIDLFSWIVDEDDLFHNDSSEGISINDFLII